MKVKHASEVAQSCPTLSDPMDCSLPGSSVHGIFQARVLEWVAIAFSRMNRTELKIRNLFSLESDSIELILVAVFQMPFIFYDFYYMHYSDIIDTVFRPLPEGENFPLSGSPRISPTVENSHLQAKGEKQYQ